MAFSIDSPAKFGIGVMIRQITKKISTKSLIIVFVIIVIMKNRKAITELKRKGSKILLIGQDLLSHCSYNKISLFCTSLYDFFEPILKSSIPAELTKHTIYSCFSLI